jgi:hypothetical protein
MVKKFLVRLSYDYNEISADSTFWTRPIKIRACAGDIGSTTASPVERAYRSERRLR